MLAQIMKFTTPLSSGRFLKRYKRFFADIEFEGQIVTAHVANTGSMKTCSEPNSPCYFSTSSNKERKLPYTLEMIQASSGAWVGVNTTIPNRIVREGLDQKLFPWWEGFDEIKAEYKISPESRLDFALTKGSSRENPEFIHFIEVKNVTLAIEKEINGTLCRVAQFPDAVSERGQKHLKDLIRLKSEGHSAEIVFTIQRDDVSFFESADQIDPTYGELLREAWRQGVRVTPVIIAVSPQKIEMTRKVLEYRHSCLFAF